VALKAIKAAGKSFAKNGSVIAKAPHRNEKKLV